MTDADQTRGRWGWLLGGTAVVLAAAIVAGLVYVRFGHQRPVPAAAPRSPVIGSLEMAAPPDFSCTLPVGAAGGAQALISLPGGAVTLDRAPTSARGAPTSYGATYQHRRWLPVPPAWVSPDGRSYAYVTQTTGAPNAPNTTAVFVHDVSRGQEQRLWSGPGHGQMAGWGPGGVYFTLQPPGPDGKGWIDVVDFWVVDPGHPEAAHRMGPNPAPPRPTSEAELPLFGAGFVKVGGGAAWTVDVGRPVGEIPPGGGRVAVTPARLVRMDLRDGSLSAWYTAPAGTGLGLSGLDALGHPVLAAVDIGDPRARPFAPPPPRLLLVNGPDQIVTIADGSEQSLHPTSVAGDAHGIWIAAPGSLWLYRAGRLTRLAGVPASLFPAPSPRPGLPTPPSPPPGYPTGPGLSIVGGCS